MINVDISNIWCSASLPQLLELEKEVFDAHCAFRKDSKDLGNRLGWLCLPEHLEQEELERVQQAAAEIRAASSALVIVGQQQACDCSRGVVELLCGTQPDEADLLSGQSVVARFSGSDGKAGGDRVLRAGDRRR